MKTFIFGLFFVFIAASVHAQTTYNNFYAAGLDFDGSHYRKLGGYCAIVWSGTIDGTATLYSYNTGAYCTQNHQLGGVRYNHVHTNLSFRADTNHLTADITADECRAYYNAYFCDQGWVFDEGAQEITDGNGDRYSPELDRTVSSYTTYDADLTGNCYSYVLGLHSHYLYNNMISDGAGGIERVISNICSTNTTLTGDAQAGYISSPVGHMYSFDNVITYEDDSAYVTTVSFKTAESPVFTYNYATGNGPGFFSKIASYLKFD